MNAYNQRIKYILADWIAVAIGWCIFYTYRYDLTGFLSHRDLYSFMTSDAVLMNLVICPFIWLAIFAFSGYYQNPLFKSYLGELQTTTVSVLVGIFLFFFSIVIDDIPIIDDEMFGIIKLYRVSPRIYLSILFTMFSCVFIPTYLCRYFITYQANQKINSGAWGLKTLLIGSGKDAALLLKELRQSKYQSGYKIIGYINSGYENVEKDLDVPYLGKISDLSNILKEQSFEAFFLAPDMRSNKVIYTLIYDLLPYNLPIRLRASNEDILSGVVKVSNIKGIPILELNGNTSPFSNNVKRAFDIFFSIVAMIILAPVMLTLCILIPLQTPGPAIYKQERIGLSRKPFQILKLRTMQVNAEANGPMLSSELDNRITPIGRILRKYRLDEIPQFWNVLKGEMSIVGPRPEREFYIKQIMESAPYYSKIMLIKPGLTSWGMVKYGYAQNVFQMIERSRYDLMYLDNSSISVDLKIIVYTIQIVLTGKGI